MHIHKYTSHKSMTSSRCGTITFLGISVSDDFGIYLGMPTAAGRTTRNNYQHIVEKMNRKLNGWKAECLSLVGRVTLAKAALSSIPQYSMQTALIPRSICDEIDRKTRRLIWGGSEEQSKIHLVSWATKDKEDGELGFKSMRQTNAAFLTKLGWRVVLEPESLWSRVLRRKYCKGHCYLDMFTPGSNASSLWKGVNENRKFIREGARVDVGNGKRTLFWDHRWALDCPLSTKVMHALPQQLDDMTVEEAWDPNTGWKWELFADLLPSDVLKQIEA